MEEAVSNEEAATIKQSAAIESEVERSREKIAEQQEALRLQAESEEQAQEKYTKDLTEKEAQLKRLQSEKDDLQSQLEKANAANQNLIENGKAPVSNTDSVQPTGRVHRLSANSTEESSLEPGAHSMSGPSEKSADAETQPADSGSRQALVTATSGSSVSVRSAPVAAVSAAAESNTASELNPEDDHAVEARQPISEPVLTEDGKAQDDEANSAKVTSINAGNRKADTTEQKPAVAEPQNNPSSDYQPTAWSVPEKAPSKTERDNLQKIKGVGPVLEKLLHQTGIWYFRQIAHLDEQGVIELDGQLPQFSGRIQRDNWVKQAKALDEEKYGSTAT